MASNTIGRNFLVAAFSILLFSACTKISTTDIGLGLLPPQDYFNTKDTIIDVITTTVDYPDTLRLYGTDNKVVGTITDDALFGSTKATMFFQLVPSNFPFSIPGNRDSLEVDSAVLILSYKGFYGDSTKPVVLNLKRIDNSTQLNFDGTQYANNYPELYNFQASTTLASPFSLDFTKVRDSVYNRYEAAASQIRIPLLSSFARMFIRNYDSTNAYLSDSTFNNSFSGFALSTDPFSNNNVLVQISLNDTNTKLALYYKSTSSSSSSYQRDTAVAYFKFSIYNNGHANFIKRNTTGSELTKHLKNQISDSLVYVQSSPGTMVKIKVPGLGFKVFQNKIIHRAELIAEQVPSDPGANLLERYLLPPRYLFLGSFDAATQRIRNVPNDFTGINDIEGMSRFGGKLQYKTLDGISNVATYNFNISRYVQGVISRKDSVFDFRILAPVNDSIQFVNPRPQNILKSTTNYLSSSSGNQPAIGRVRLGGGTHSKRRMRLHIYYSDL